MMRFVFSVNDPVNRVCGLVFGRALAVKSVMIQNTLPDSNSAGPPW